MTFDPEKSSKWLQYYQPAASQRRKWYEVKAEGKKLKVVIYDFINDWYGFSARELKKELMAAGDISEILVEINSRGGSVIEGNAIYSDLLEHPAKVTVRINGVAASIATIIAMAADHIQIAENGQFMYHEPWQCACGTGDELIEAGHYVNNLRPAMVRVYQRHCTLSEQELLDGMKAETWLSAQEALEQGFVHEIVAKADASAMAMDFGMFQNAPAQLRTEGPKPEPESADKPTKVKPEPDKPTPGVPAAAARLRNLELEQLSDSGR